jgi:hypothetical protein
MGGFAVIRFQYLPTSEHSRVLDGWFSITATVAPIKHFRVRRSGACVAERRRCCTLGGHVYRCRHPDVAVKWLPLLLRIRKIPVSYLGPTLAILNAAFRDRLKTNDRRTVYDRTVEVRGEINYLGVKLDTKGGWNIQRTEGICKGNLNSFFMEYCLGKPWI